MKVKVADWIVNFMLVYTLSYRDEELCMYTEEVSWLYLDALSM